MTAGGRHAEPTSVRPIACSVDLQNLLSHSTRRLRCASALSATSCSSTASQHSPPHPSAAGVCKHAWCCSDLGRTLRLSFNSGASVAAREVCEGKAPVAQNCGCCRPVSCERLLRPGRAGATSTRAVYRMRFWRRTGLPLHTHYGAGLRTAAQRRRGMSATLECSCVCGHDICSRQVCERAVRSPAFALLQAVLPGATLPHCLAVMYARLGKLSITGQQGLLSQLLI
jgi:hypothetical protein